MIKAYSAQQIRDAEKPLLDAGEPLMQLAAAGLANEIALVLSSRRAQGLTVGPDPAVVLLLIGTGNNGGDALFAGAELAHLGERVLVFRTGDRVHQAGFDAAVAAGAHEIDVDQLTNLAHVDVIIDGILGTGAASGNDAALRGTARAVVAQLIVQNGETFRPPAFVVAVDIPSGVNPTTGDVPDQVVLRADTTVTFGGHKAGLLLQPAADYAGSITLIDIGLQPYLESVVPLLTRDAPTSPSHAHASE